MDGNGDAQTAGAEETHEEHNSLSPFALHQRNAERIQRQVAPFKQELLNHVPQRERDDFVSALRASTSYQMSYDPGSSQANAFIDRKLKDYGLYWTLNNNPPREDSDTNSLDAGCFGTELQTLIDQLTIHQKADCVEELRILRETGHLILSNDPGMGKTGTLSLLPLLLAANTQAESSSNGTSPNSEFLPTLFVVHSSIIEETYKFMRFNFPLLKPVLFYEPKGIFLANCPERLGTDELCPFLKGLMENTGSPENARYVILTTPGRFGNQFKDVERPFVELKGKDNEPEPIPNGRGQRRPRRQSHGRVRNDSHRTALHGNNGHLYNGYRERETPEEAIARCRRDLTDKRGKHSPKWLPEDIEMAGTPIHLVDGVEGLKPDGIVMESWFKNEQMKDIRFQMVIVDDAHNARNISSKLNQNLRVVNFMNLVWVTELPLISDPYGPVSPLFLIWKKFGIHFPRCVMEHIRNLVGLFHPRYDPYEEFNDLDGLVTEGIFHPNFKARNPEVDWEKMEYIWNSRGFPIWKVDYLVYFLAGEQMGWTREFVVKATTTLLGILSHRRTGSSRLRLPNGSFAYPDIDRPPVNIQMHDVTFSSFQKEIYQAKQQGARLAFRTGHTEHVPDRLNERSIRKASQRKLELQKGGINFGAYRRFTMDSTFWLFNGLGGTTLDHDQIRAIIKGRDYGILQHFIPLAKLVCDPYNRRELSAFVHRYSPSIERVAQICTESKNHRKRVLVQCYCPVLAFMTAESLRALGFISQTVSGAIPRRDRKRTFAQFNNPASSIEVLVANIDVLGLAGINLSNCCCTGIIVNHHYNFETQQHFIGLLDRSGQNQPVDIHIINVKDSFADVQQFHALGKAATTSAALMKIPAGLDKFLEDVFTFEIFKTQYGHSFNRYAWFYAQVNDNWKAPMHSTEVKKLGHAMSCLAKLMLRPNADLDFWRQRGEHIMLTLQRHTMDRLEEYLELSASELMERIIADQAQAGGGQTYSDEYQRLFLIERIHDYD